MQLIKNIEDKQRYNWIDWMKVIGMLLIVWGHTSPVYLTEFLYTFNVGLFFIISGFLSKCKPDVTIREWGKIFHMLIVPYFYLCVINLAIYSLRLVIKGNFTSEIFMNSIVADLLGYQGLNIHGIGCGPLWFIYTLVIVKTICLYQNSKQLYYLSLLCLVSSVILNYLGYCQDWAVINSLLALPCFTFGLYLASFKQKIIVLKDYISQMQLFNKILLVVSLFSITYVISLINGQVWMFKCNYGESILLFMAGTITGTTAIAVLSMILDRIQLNVINVISKGNIIILALHLVILNYMLIVINRICMFPGLSIVVTLILSVVVVLIFYPVIIITNKYFPAITGNR